MSKFLFIAMNNFGDSFSGGDTIWINLANRWDADLLLSEEAANLYKGKRSPYKPYTLFNIFKDTIYKLFIGIKRVHSLPESYHEYVYSVSDFYPDLIPALYYKFKTGCKWIAGYYLVAPFPLAKNSPYKGKDFFRGLLYWMMQIPSRLIVNLFADYTFVTSESERKYFSNKTIVVKGGIKLGDVKLQKWFDGKYDCLFVGRLHFQKGILDLIDIWDYLINTKRKHYKLCIIGDGILKQMMIQKIISCKLQKYIDYVGYKNGEEKYKIFKQSKIFMHLSTFDSGGMAAAEAMGYGMPVIGYDLETFVTYYEKGMKKCSSKPHVANEIIKMLSDYNLWEYYSKMAYQYAKEKWTWEKRSKQIINQIT